MGSMQGDSGSIENTKATDNMDFSIHKSVYKHKNTIQELLLIFEIRALQ